MRDALREYKNIHHFALRFFARPSSFRCPGLRHSLTLLGCLSASFVLHEWALKV